MAHFFTETASDAELKREARLVVCERALLVRGIAIAQVEGIDLDALAEEYAQASPQSVFFEDGEYAQYRNVVEDPDFPLAAIVACLEPVLASRFGRDPGSLALDDAFVIHYAMHHSDTTVKKHTDPSDITVNLCLDQSPDFRGSQIVFYGTRHLVGPIQLCSSGVGDCDCMRPVDDAAFCVATRRHHAMVHFGAHPHETLPLEAGTRTNCVLTFRYKETETPLC